MENMELLFGLMLISASGWVIAIYLLVQLFIDLVRRRGLRLWSIVWLAGAAIFAIGCLTQNALSQNESDGAMIASFLLILFVPFGLMLAALLLFRADRRRQRILEQMDTANLDTPNSAWPPAPKSGDS